MAKLIDIYGAIDGGVMIERIDDDNDITVVGKYNDKADIPLYLMDYIVTFITVYFITFRSCNRLKVDGLLHIYLRKGNNND